MLLIPGKCVQHLKRFTQVWFYFRSHKQMDDDHIYCLLAIILKHLISCIGEHHRLCSVRAGRPLPDTDSGHTECRHSHQGSRGAGCRALACGIPLAAVSVSPKLGQCQPQRCVDRLRSQRFPRGQGQPHWCDCFS